MLSRWSGGQDNVEMTTSSRSLTASRISTPNPTVRGSIPPTDLESMPPALRTSSPVLGSRPSGGRDSNPGPYPSGIIPPPGRTSDAEGPSLGSSPPAVVLDSRPPMRVSMALTARAAADVAHLIISRSPRLRDVMWRSADSVARDWIDASTSTGLIASRLQSYGTDDALPDSDAIDKPQNMAKNNKIYETICIMFVYMKSIYKNHCILLQYY